jgi:mannose-1-phosphate guanylyltransferase / mannose-6-phosphate isomerase
MSCRMIEIIPVLLAGGQGTRLWPLSRKSYPKQLSNLIGEQSLFKQSALRLISVDTVKFALYITMTNLDIQRLNLKDWSKYENDIIRNEDKHLRN